VRGKTIGIELVHFARAQHNIELMEYNFRHSKSLHGYDTDTLLSALQKYIRRGDLNAALYAGMELEYFSELPAAVPLVTNTVNRLRVALAEETAGLTWPAMVEKFDWKYRVFDNNRRGNVAARRAAFLNMITMLVMAKKQRLISDIKAVYFTPDAKALALASDNPTLRRLYPEVYTFDSQVIDAHYTLLPGDDEPRLRLIVDGLLTAMKRKSDHGFYWLNQLVLATQDGVAVAKRKKTMKDKTSQAHPMYLLSELCYAYARKGARLWDNSAPVVDAGWTRMMCAALDVCFEYDKHFGLNAKGVPKHRDWVVFTIWPLLYCVRNVDWSHNDVPFTPITPDEAQEFYKKHAAAPTRVFDDFVFDQHTAKGRSLNRGPEFFAEHGALVLNEDESLHNASYRLLYNEFKKVQPKRKKTASKRTTNNDDDDNDSGDEDEDEDDKEKKNKRAKK